MLIVFEHKINLEANLEKSFQEATRDFAEKFDPLDLLSLLAVGYSVLTDAVSWRFVRFEAVYSQQEGKFRLSTDIPDPIEICTIGQTESEPTQFDFEELAMWLTYVAMQSIVAPKEAPDMAVLDDITPTLELSSEEGKETSFEVSTLRGKGRFCVFKGHLISVNADKNDSVVLKIPLLRRNKNGAKRLLDERNNLRLFKHCQSIVNMVDSEDAKDTYFFCCLRTQEFL